MTEINDLIDEGNALDANGNPEKARSERYSTVDIFVSLLEGAAAENRKGIAITILMYAWLVSYRQMTLHLQVLLKERLLEYDEQGKVYKITTRRLQFLEMYTKMAEMLK